MQPCVRRASGTRLLLGSVGCSSTRRSRLLQSSPFKPWIFFDLLNAAKQTARGDVLLFAVRISDSRLADKLPDLLVANLTEFKSNDPSCILITHAGKFGGATQATVELLQLDRLLKNPHQVVAAGEDQATAQAIEELADGLQAIDR